MTINKEEIREMVMQYFLNLFEKDATCDISVGYRGGFPIIDQPTMEEVMKKLTEEDIKHAVMEMASFKAPGPDGLHAAFYQHMWPVVGDSIVNMVMDFFKSGVMPDGINDTIITLIPKVDNPERPAQFRPISLCNVSYKIITKTITNRLKTLMREVVGPYQSSFVPERKIIDNIRKCSIR